MLRAAPRYNVPPPRWSEAERESLRQTHEDDGTASEDRHEKAELRDEDGGRRDEDEGDEEVHSPAHDTENGDWIRDEVSHSESRPEECAEERIDSMNRLRRKGKMQSGRCSDTYVARQVQGVKRRRTKAI